MFQKKSRLLLTTPSLVFFPFCIPHPNQQIVLKTETPFFRGAPAIITGAVGPFDFSAAGTESMTTSINGGAAVTITFADSDFYYPASATASEVAAAVNADLTTAGVSGYLSASASSGRVVLTTNLTGVDASIKVTEGSGLPASILGLTTTRQTGAQFVATENTLINDLPDNLQDYEAGAVIHIEGVLSGGARVSGDFVYGSQLSGTTLGDLRDLINQLFQAQSGEGATCSIDAQGFMVLQSNRSHPRDHLQLIVFDSTTDGFDGSTGWASHVFRVVHY